MDNDCNGQVDEGLLNTYYLDNDGDGLGNTNGDFLPVPYRLVLLLWRETAMIPMRMRPHWVLMHPVHVSLVWEFTSRSNLAHGDLLDSTQLYECLSTTCDMSTDGGGGPRYPSQMHTPI